MPGIYAWYLCMLLSLRLQLIGAEVILSAIIATEILDAGYRVT